MNMNDIFIQDNCEIIDIEEKKNIIQLVAFKLADEEYAVDVSQVIEIKKLIAITRVPKAQNYYFGVINLRGSVIPILDLKKIINIPTSQNTKSNRIIILKINSITFGIVADSVSEVIEADKEEIKNPEKINLNLEKKYISGIGKYDGRVFILLNLAEIIQSAS